MCFQENMMNWKKELGIQIREGREDSYLRQKDLRSRAGVHINMISRYERGEAAPDLDVLIRLASALDKQEFRIGEYRVLIKSAAETDDASSHTKQMRLEYGKEYMFDGGDSSMKIQPSKEGLFITPEKRKATA